MKKVSSAAITATKNFSQPKLTIGLDLGDRSSWYCELEERGEVVLEQKVTTTPKAMRENARSSFAVAIGRKLLGLFTSTLSKWWNSPPTTAW